MKLLTNKYFYTCLINVSILISGCGQKGPLILPDEKKIDTQSQNHSHSLKINLELI